MKRTRPSYPLAWSRPLVRLGRGRGRGARTASPTNRPSDPFAPLGTGSGRGPRTTSPTNRPSDPLTPMGKGSGRGAYQRLKNDAEHGISLKHHLLVVEAQHAQPPSLEITGSLHVPKHMLRLGVLPPVHFDNKPRLSTVEVENVRPEWMLPTELVTRKPLSTQAIPEPSLSIRRSAPETPGVCSRMLGDSTGHVRHTLSLTLSLPRGRGLRTNDFSIITPARQISFPLPRGERARVRGSQSIDDGEEY